ncbi:MAG: hypothetical protein HY314_09225 [Acidobacteria bacterium]|nr:hypothetical protein [Acidobacteriota bacterium]
MSRRDRRRFLKTAGTATATSLMIGLTGSVGESTTEELLVTGTSQKGDLQEALEDAIAKAFAQGPQHPDVLLNFEIRSVKGSVGGIAGLNEVRLTICARFA